MTVNPDPTPPGEPEGERRRTIECPECGARARWNGSTYVCRNGHEADS